LIRVRLDETASAALDVMRADGMSDSEAVRAALRESATRRRRRSAVRQEVRSLTEDRADPAEMRSICRHMDELAPAFEE
jgi:Arc/MetJ-type ribon-helix-helix transcriptional regulator